MHKLTIAAAAVIAATGISIRAQQGIGQTPAPYPLSQTIRERGSSVTGAFEGWYYTKDGGVSLLVGYFNRNTKQELDVAIGPNNRIEPGGPDRGQPTHFMTGRQYGVFSINVPKDFGKQKLTWTLIVNGQTNAITLHAAPDWIVEPYEDPANKNTPPRLQFESGGAAFSGPPRDIAAHYQVAVGVPLPLTAWITDEGPKLHIPEPRRANRGSTTPALPQAPAIAVAWSVMRGPAAVTFDKAKPAIDREAGGKTMTNATFSAPGEYLLRVQGNDSTGDGGGGFQCCWTNALVAVSVKAP